jgi:hypothetical protein
LTSPGDRRPDIAGVWPPGLLILKHCAWTVPTFRGQGYSETMRFVKELAVFFMAWDWV